MPKPEDLLAEAEETIRSMPSQYDLYQGTEDALEWMARAGAIVEASDPVQAVPFRLALSTYHAGWGKARENSVNTMAATLRQVKHGLLLKTSGPRAIAIDTGKRFDYFEVLRRIIEGASKDLLFADPYLDADFVSRYLPHVRAGVVVRLLSCERIPALMSAAEAFALQNLAIQVQVRSIKFHDRYVFVDGKECYQSGASFKDGAKSAPTVISQIVDAFPAVQKTYEDLWQAAAVIR